MDHILDRHGREGRLAFLNQDRVARTTLPTSSDEAPGVPVGGVRPQIAAAMTPWSEIVAFAEKLPTFWDFPPKLYKADLWHNWHLGGGRYFLASCVVAWTSGADPCYANSAGTT